MTIQEYIVKAIEQRLSREKSKDLIASNQTQAGFVPDANAISVVSKVTKNKSMSKQEQEAWAYMDWEDKNR